jgi:hypothetical protein
MLLRLSNRLPMELPDLFSMPLLGEGPRKDSWCVVATMDQSMDDIELSHYLNIANSNTGKTTGSCEKPAVGGTTTNMCQQQNQ